MALRRSRNRDLQDHFSVLAARADDAESQRREVVSRESKILEFRDEMYQIRKDNHFTQLFLRTVGGGA